MKSNAIVKLFVILGFAMALAITTKGFAKETKTTAAVKSAKRKPAQQENVQEGILPGELKALFDEETAKKLEDSGHTVGASEIAMVRSALAGIESSYKCKNKFLPGKIEEKGDKLKLVFQCDSVVRSRITFKQVKNGNAYHFSGLSVQHAKKK